ncbi:1,6-anhydro-N-acetylmuramyl-L-alanine amidase AmpD [mine drainage metagenome]|jgi:AmpD protein|uniref:1,6-anhydro-N-acetylmuramyl-L-alanine amidase AmpD n=1 Tax=mine drainage metagenome TaxID=410659 RepID=A0A1J5R6I9_9ZZZZ
MRSEAPHGAPRFDDGWYAAAQRRDSPHFDARPPGSSIDLIVVHAISLPPGRFGGPQIDALFRGCLDTTADPALADLAGLRVSAHFLVRRDGELLQYVSCAQRAWHAGVSSHRGRTRCNDFSVGIELEGSDHEAFEPAQYETLARLLPALCRSYPIRDIVGHCDIAPQRKTDPGPHFDWAALRRIDGLPPALFDAHPR